MVLATKLLELVPSYRRLCAERDELAQRVAQANASADPILSSLAAEHQPWLRELAAAQAELSELVTLPYYNSPQEGRDSTGKAYSFPSYRSAEAYYWTHVPRWIQEDSSRRPVRRSLDIGCSYGTLSLLTHKLCGADIHLCDFIDVYMSKKLLDRYGFHFAVCNIETDELPFEGSFDQILFTEIVEHLNFHPVPTLKKLARSLAPEGRLYVTTPDAADHGRLAFYKTYRDMPMPRKNDQPPIDAHIYQFERFELMEVLDEAGLIVERFDWAPGYGGGSMRHMNLSCRLR